MGLMPDVHRGATLTREQYAALEAAGKLTRPINSPPMGRRSSKVSFVPDTPTKGRDTKSGRLS